MTTMTGRNADQVAANALAAQGASVLAMRQNWYGMTGDALYFQEQRGEIPVGTWKAAVEAMKIANPYPAGFTPPTVSES